MNATSTSPAIQFVNVSVVNESVTLRISGAYYTRNEMMRVVMQAAHALVKAMKNTRWPMTLGKAMKRVFSELRFRKNEMKKAAAAAARKAAFEAEEAAKAAAKAQPSTEATELATAVAKSGSLRELCANVSETEGYQNWVRRGNRRGW